MKVLSASLLLFFLLSFILVLLPSATLSTPLPPHQASFASLIGLTTLTRDYSAPPKHASKFFREAKFHPHYDGRFASSTLPQQSCAVHLRLLVKSYMETMTRLGVQTWIVHGSLLGWWWNGAVLPWDSDVDVMVDERGMFELGEWWGMSVHPFSGEELGLLDEEDMQGLEEEHRHALREDGKKYLLEVNPHYVNPDVKDKYNVIDARWIDTSTGLFIDITTVHSAPGNKEEMFTKDSHAYSRSQIFPLRPTVFEGVPVHVPYAYEELLLEEYGPKALTETWFKGYEFDGKEWIDDSLNGQQSLGTRGRKGRRREEVGDGSMELADDEETSDEAGKHGNTYKQKIYEDTWK